MTKTSLITLTNTSASNMTHFISSISIISLPTFTSSSTKDINILGHTLSPNQLILLTNQCHILFDIIISHDIKGEPELGILSPTGLALCLLLFLLHTSGVKLTDIELDTISTIITCFEVNEQDTSTLISTLLSL